MSLLRFTQKDPNFALSLKAGNEAIKNGFSPLKDIRKLSGEVIIFFSGSEK